MRQLSTVCALFPQRDRCGLIEASTREVGIREVGTRFRSVIAAASLKRDQIVCVPSRKTVSAA